MKNNNSNKKLDENEKRGNGQIDKPKEEDTQSTSSEEKTPKTNENKPVKNTIKSMTYLIVLAGLIGGSVYMYQKKEVVKESSTIKVQDYSSLLNSWNEQVQNRTDKKEFLLSRDSNEKVMEQLNGWMKNFYILEVTDSREYNEFLESSKLKKLLEFNKIMSEDEIWKKLKTLTKEKTMSSIVQKVLMMNDIEFWKKNKEKTK